MRNFTNKAIIPGIQVYLKSFRLSKKTSPWIKTLAMYLLLVTLMLAGPNASVAQMYVSNTSSTGGASGNYYPWSVPSAGVGSKVELTYAPGDFNILARSGNITKLYFRFWTTYAISYTNFTISMGQASSVSPTNTFSTVSTVFGPSNITIAPSYMTWYGINLATPFHYDSTKILIITIQQNGITSLPGTNYENTVTGSILSRYRIYGSYGASVGDGNDVSWKYDLGFDVCPSPFISLQPIPVSICSGSNTSFSVNGSGVGSAYQWQVNSGSGFGNVSNGGFYSNALTPTLNISGATTAINGYQYHCIITSSCSTPTTSNLATLTVNSLPSISSSPSSLTVNAGSNVLYTVTATGTSLTYQWQENQTGTWTNLNSTGIYSNTATPTLNLTGVTTAMGNFQYRCVVSGTCSPAATSSAATLSIPAGALNFDGVSNYVAINNPYTTFGKEITVDWWVKPNSASNMQLGSGIGQGITGFDDASHNVWNMHFDGTGTSLTFYVNNGSGFISSGPATGMSAGTWHHVVGVASATGIFIYVDGSLVNHSNTGTGPGIFQNASAVLQFGRDVRYPTSSAPARYGNMSIDEVRIYNRALCTAEITNNSSCELSGTLNGLVEYYQFDQGFIGGTTNPSTLTDGSGNYDISPGEEWSQNQINCKELR